MGYSLIPTAALVGSTGRLVNVEADVSPGLPTTRLLGLPDTCSNPTLDRVRAAVANAGLDWPSMRVTINISAPDAVRPESSWDLAIAIAVLAAADTRVDQAQPTTMLLGELGLDGSIRPVRGVLPMVISGAPHVTGAVVPEANADEAALAPDVAVLAARSLSQVAQMLKGGHLRPVKAPDTAPYRLGTSPSEGQLSDKVVQPDLRDIVGQPLGRFALELSAVGGHSLLLVGPAGSAKTMLAERLVTLLPDLSDEQALEVAAIHSAAGLAFPPSRGYQRPPYVAPHHTSATAALLGGGTNLRPGAVSLAHHGVLALLDAPEFLSSALQALRYPLREEQVTLARADVTVSMPAGGISVLTATPCSCATPARNACGCSAQIRHRYRQRLNPLLSNIDITVYLNPTSGMDLRAASAAPESSADVAARVATARRRSAKRLELTPWRTNAQIPATALVGDLQLSPTAITPLLRASDTGALSAASLASVQRMAWTLADMADIPEPTAKETRLALALAKGLDTATFTRSG
ncbi:YifB family Mg chelatase-like AAA ATPase [Nonomuraea maheshkhaliensis]|uniref:YifB family Mg chelatase-like AAA ATPase n=1 Tax=Nonomuraea maheshkhaliensis TaxID=419590 RepID=A0ABP4QUP5_9ACTN